MENQDDFPFEVSTISQTTPKVVGKEHILTINFVSKSGFKDLNNTKFTPISKAKSVQRQRKPVHFSRTPNKKAKANVSTQINTNISNNGDNINAKAKKTHENNKIHKNNEFRPQKETNKSPISIDTHSNCFEIAKFCTSSEVEHDNLIDSENSSTSNTNLKRIVHEIHEICNQIDDIDNSKGEIGSINDKVIISEDTDQEHQLSDEEDYNNYESDDSTYKLEFTKDPTKDEDNDSSEETEYEYEYESSNCEKCDTSIQVRYNRKDQKFESSAIQSQVESDQEIGESYQDKNNKEKEKNSDTQSPTYEEDKNDKDNLLKDEVEANNTNSNSSNNDLKSSLEDPQIENDSVDKLEQSNEPLDDKIDSELSEAELSGTDHNHNDPQEKAINDQQILLSEDSPAQSPIKPKKAQNIQEIEYEDASTDEYDSHHSETEYPPSPMSQSKINVSKEINDIIIGMQNEKPVITDSSSLYQEQNESENESVHEDINNQSKVENSNVSSIQYGDSGVWMFVQLDQTKSADVEEEEIKHEINLAPNFSKVVQILRADFEKRHKSNNLIMKVSRLMTPYKSYHFIIIMNQNNEAISLYKAESDQLSKIWGSGDSEINYNSIQAFFNFDFYYKRFVQSISNCIDDNTIAVVLKE